MDYGCVAVILCIEAAGFYDSDGGKEGEARAYCETGCTATNDCRIIRRRMEEIEG
jgi:hypothetical protein